MSKKWKNSWRRKYSADVPSAKNIPFRRMQIHICCTNHHAWYCVTANRQKTLIAILICLKWSRLVNYHLDSPDTTCRFLHVVNLIFFVQTFNYLMIYVEKKCKNMHRVIYKIPSRSRAIISYYSLSSDYE